MNRLTIILVCILSFIGYKSTAQVAANVKTHSSIPQEALKMDLSKTPDVWLPTPNSHLPQRAGNGWHPVKGEIYYVEDASEIAGYVSITIGQNGMPDKEIVVGNNPNLYDSTVSVMNRTPYTQGKNLLDTTYNYNKKADGSYVLALRRIYSWHYFDHFEGDSLYYEAIYQTWDDNDKQWINFLRQKTGFHNTLIEFPNRSSRYSYGAGNTWKLDFYFYDSITYDHRGFVDSLYMIRNNGNGNMLPTAKIGFTNDEQGRYTQMDYFVKQGNKWNESDIFSDITWTEWDGFTYSSMSTTGYELSTPYQRSKIKSYYINSEGQGNFFYQKWWDINGTKTNSDTLYWRGTTTYPCLAKDHIYNEYGDYVEYRETNMSYSDETGELTVYNYLAHYHKYTYDEIYGMTEHKVYFIALRESEIDTTFVEMVRYTEFAPVSITEPKETRQIAVYPNPGNNMITIGIASDDFTFRMYDLTGKLVLEQKNQKSISTKFLPSGMYLYRVFSENWATASGKWVKD